jgi:hypothetical protein
MARPPGVRDLPEERSSSKRVIRIAAKCLTTNGGYPWRALLFRLHFDGSRRCWVFSSGRMSGYGMMLCLCGFPLVVLGSQPFRVMLEMFFVPFLLCFVAHRSVYGRYSH